jgi:hypothetical protein
VTQLAPLDAINLPLRNPTLNDSKLNEPLLVQGPNHTNLNAHNDSGGYGVASGNVNRAQNNKGRGQRRGRGSHSQRNPNGGNQR